MIHSHFSLGAGIAGAVLLALPVLKMILGAGAPDAVDAIVGLFGFVMLAAAATAGRTWPDGVSRADSSRRRSRSARRDALRASPAAR
jgi:hypothetical protein